MKKTIILWSILLIILLTIGFLIVNDRWLLIYDKFFQDKDLETQENNISQELVLIIDNGENSPKYYTSTKYTTTTAFILLQEGAEELELTLKTNVYDIGILIESIGDKENTQDEKYWLYYINEEIPMISADKKEIKLGDTVEFKFEKSQF